MSEQIQKSVLEYDRETLEKALVETALAYHNRGAFVQYDTKQNVTAQGGLGAQITTMEQPPEWCGADRSHYSICRGLISDVYYEAFGMTIHGNRYGVHPSLEDEDVRRSVVLCFGDKENFPDTAYTDKEAFLKEYRKVIRPGDYIMADKRTSHLMMYLGDCFGTGEEYMIHCWPVYGGKWDPETGINKLEPYGTGHIQPVDELNFSSENSPKWDLTKDEMFAIWLFRPSRMKAFQKLTMPEKTLSRIRYSGLSLNKYANKSLYDSVLPGEILTITEEISNYGREPYEGLLITEPVPEGTRLIASSVLAEGAGRGTKLSVKDGNVVLSLNLPPFEKATLSFRVRVTGQPGDAVRVMQGSADHIPTRAFGIRIAKSKFNLNQLESIYMYGNSNTRFRTFFEGASRDLESVNDFYRKVTGKEIHLPKTAQELLDALFDVKELPAIVKDENGESTEGTETMLKLKENLPADLAALRIPRYTGGKYVALSDDIQNPDRSFDYLSGHFSEGDVFVLLKGENKTSVVNPEDLQFGFFVRDDLVYLWNDREWHKYSWKDSLAAGLGYNVVIALRPNNVY